MVARFLFQSGHFSSTKKRIRPSGFMPALDGTTSVFQIRGLTEEEIWEFGNWAGQGRGAVPLARGDLVIQAIRDIHLEVVIDNDPPNHGNIVNWPSGKDEKIAKAQQLSEIVANFTLRPN